MNIIARAFHKIDVFHPAVGATIYYLFAYVFVLAPLLHVPGKLVSASTISWSWRVLLFIALGIISMWAGVLAARRLPLRSPALFAIPWDARRASLVFSGFFALGAAAKLIRWSQGTFSHLGRPFALDVSVFSSIAGFLDVWSLVALAFAFIIYFQESDLRGRRFRVWQKIAWGVFSIEVVMGLLSGSKYAVVAPIMVYVIVKHYLARPSYRRLILLAITAMAIVMPVINFYSAPHVFKTSYMLGGRSDTEKEFLEFAVDNSIGRLSSYFILHGVFHNTKEFWHGRDLTEFITHFGPPRFLWKSKPVSINGYSNEFGRAWGIVRPDDLRTTVGPTVMGDWYLNFGVWGIVLGMFGMGVLFQGMYRLLAAPRQAGGILLYSIAWLSMMQGLEGWLAPSYAGLVKVLALLFVCHLFLTKRIFKGSSGHSTTPPLQAG